MYDRKLTIAQIESFEIDIKSKLRNIKRAKDHRLAKQLYAKLGTLTNLAKRTWTELEQSK